MTSRRIALAFVLALATVGRGLAQNTFADLYDQASDLYEKASWAACTEKFVAASAAAEDRQASRALLRAAACAARAGKQEATDFAFQFLAQAASRGGRDVDRLATEPDYAPLRKDPRWKPMFDQVQARAA